MTEYLANLQRRDKFEQANARLIAEYSKVADRSAAAEAKLRTFETGAGTEDTGSAAEGQSAGLLAHLRGELEAARDKATTLEKAEAGLAERAAQLQDRLGGLEKESAEQTAKSEKLARHVAALTRRLKDRDAEARESRKLVERLQDEMIGLNLEKNMAVQRMEDAEAQLKELEGRLMEWKRKEAEKICIHGYDAWICLRTQ